MAQRRGFLGGLLVLGAATAALVAPAVASAASISVTTTVDELAAANGSCSLREAMINANTNTDASGGDCASGALGADTISLTGLSGTIALRPFFLGGLGDLPGVTDALSLSGPGASTLTLNVGGGERGFLVIGTTATISGLTITGVNGGNGSFVGGVYLHLGASVTIERATITGNSTNSYGAGVNSFFSDSGSVTIRDSTISNNTGGGIANTVSLTIERSTISGNSAVLGAGLLNNGIAVIRDSAISGNAAGAGGAIMNHGLLTIERSTISANSAAQGGGIYSDSPGATIRNSTIVGNSATQVAGGLLGGITLIENSTITGNSAPLGGGFWNGQWTLRNTIVAGQSATGGNCSAAIITDGGYNLEDGTSCGFSAANHSLPNTNPLLDPAGLQGNGGATKTIALLLGSPAQNVVPAGLNGCGTTIAVDQRGVSRPQGPACDLGAFELEQQSAAELLAALANKVQGIGPGASLFDKVTAAQAAEAVGDIAGVCIALSGFTNQIKAQAGKSIPPATADMLLADAAQIRTSLGC